MLLQLAMPAKTFTRILYTSLWFVSKEKAVLIWCLFALPPTSKKLAGDPPFSLIISIVDMASPAPFTMHPIFPSRPTYENPTFSAIYSF